MNGTSLGRQAMKPDSKLTWQVKYAPGTLSAKGFDDAGNVIAETKVETTGDATQIQLTPDRSTINADGEDVSVFTVSALDAQGRAVPVAQNKINFAIEGPGKILGVGNGDPSSHEPDTFIPQPVEKIMPFNDWRWKLARLPGHDMTAKEYNANFDDSAWDQTSSEGEHPQLTEGQSAIFRQHLELTAEQLAWPGIQIYFGRIDDHGWVFVNGRSVLADRTIGKTHRFLTSKNFCTKATTSSLSLYLMKRAQADWTWVLIWNIPASRSRRHGRAAYSTDWRKSSSNPRRTRVK